MEVAQDLGEKPHFSDPFLKILVERGLAHDKEYVVAIGVRREDMARVVVSSED
jgi:hypothetical protein